MAHGQRRGSPAGVAMARATGKARAIRHEPDAGPRPVLRYIEGLTFRHSID